MNKSDTISILYATAITLSLIYAPQPLTPLLANYFNIKPDNAAFIISLTLLPMAIAPAIYGYFLEKISPKKILIFSMFMCGILQFISTLSNDFYVFLTLRLLQSLFFPAILTTLLTILTRLSTADIQKNSSLYVSATIIGGLIGRIVGSYLTGISSWQTSFNIFAILMVLGGFWLFGIEDIKKTSTSKITFKSVFPFLKDRRYIWLLSSVFIMFFSFQTILSFLPFFLVDSNPLITESQIGFIYIGYLAGIVVSLFATKTTRIMHSKPNAISLGLVVFGIGVLIVLSEDFYIILLGMFILCAGSFTAHSILTALMNSISEGKKGITNGLYLTFYYTGGVLGSFIPSFFYHYFGWWFVCLFTSIILFLNAFLFLRYKYIYLKA
ncbi:MFS transporter [Helicobacter sp. 13S00477-4]|uniref:MFS transporter n=1 Tax=Helicobacter sp. 13S00477-4 TaxID=1905759 RepID=UPI000BA71CCE|nr:MFS transporter [Helicobacter sp. 13S00477-4]PAF50497.1 hypothetical protein BKH44_08050 [Helicobacter sp. 13S00477-4]